MSQAVKISHSAADAAGKGVKRVFSFLRNIFALLGILLVTLFILTALGITRTPVFNPFSKGETTISSTGIGGSFEDIAELSTEEYQFTNVGKYDAAGLKFFDFKVPLSGKSFLVSYDGTVKAGIADAKQITVKEDAANKEVVISAPKPVAMQTKLDPNSVKVYDQSMNPLNQIGVEDVTKFIAAEEKTAQDKAIEKGLLDRAQTSCGNLLESYYRGQVKGTERENYKVTVEWK